jgi:hypothetical protein
MKKGRKTVEVWGLGKLPKRAAFVLAFLAILVVLGAIGATNLAVNYGVLRARVLFLEKITTSDFVPEDVDELYERAIKLQPPMDLSPKLNEILSMCEKIEAHLDRPVVVSLSQIEKLKGGLVYLVGVVTKVTKKDPHIFLTVNDVFVPVFNSSKEMGYIREGYKIAVSGQVKEYQGQLEVVPNSISDIMVLEAP